MSGTEVITRVEERRFLLVLVGSRQSVGVVAMKRGFRATFSHALCSLVAAGLLAAAIPGCGEAPKQGEAAGGGVPPTVQESNKQMEDFMKSQQAGKK
jgi:hypothetical protein